jgi:imidazolonepropionase-like amidohydrolase
MTSQMKHRVPMHLDNARVIDPVSGGISSPMTITVVDGLIAEVKEGDPAQPGDHLNLTGLFVLPGLIDCHVHVTAFSADEARITDTSPSYVTARAAKSMREMLMRGFTTVRDAAGADYGLAAAVAEGLFLGPRLLFGGPGLTQTGGHADHRLAGQHDSPQGARFPSHGVVCDGEVEVRRAARDVLRTGADHIKIMLSGGVASPTDRVDSSQFSASEIRTVVEEAESAGRYVMGHAYPARAINRGLEAGVRSVEHGNLLDDTSIELFVRMKAFLVPTLITYRALAEEGERWGLPAKSAAKVKDLLEFGLEALRRADAGGVQVAFGTDLLGGMQRLQSEEFALRGKVQAPLTVIRSATVVGAKLLGLEEVIGEIKPGFAADLIAVTENPLDHLETLADPENRVRLVMRAGEVVRNSV